MKRLTVLVALLLAMGSASMAGADGESHAGLVIDWGDGTLSTHCVDFTGDGIAGEELLSRAGYGVNDFSGLVCGIGDTGCTHSGSFGSCLCECQSGGPDCTYWAFFTRPAGAQDWQYSAIGYRAQRANNGEMHGWAWATGQIGQAPPPPAPPFEAVCAATEVPTATPPGAPSPMPTPSATPAPVNSTLETPETTPVPTSEASEPPADISETPQAAPSTPTNTAPTSTPQAVATAEEDQSPAPPATGNSGNNGGTKSLVLFGIVAAGLATVIASGLFWRRRHGR
jgi:hypothetical protein